VVVSDRRRPPQAVVWHELECGSYAADLPLWRELAAVAAGPVLDVGAGSGRVALDLARRGHRVTALDRDAELLAALREHATASGVEVELVHADARALSLARSDFALCVVPMQTLQLLGGAAGRAAFLAGAHAHLAPGGVLACAIVTHFEPFDCAAGDAAPTPETTCVHGARFVSHPIRVRVERHTVRIERERQIVPAGRPAAAHHPPAASQATHPPAASQARHPPAASQATRPPLAHDVVELDRVSVAQLQREGRAAGFTALGTRAIAATSEHTGSVAVIFGV